MQTSVLEAPSRRPQSIVASTQVDGNNSVSFLDSAIPLKGASHGDVVSYSVETIWRKAECIATLAGGRKAKLHDTWQFIGYTGHSPARCLLFRNNGRHIEIQIDSGELIVAAEQRRTKSRFEDIKNSLIRVLNRRRTYTAVDGSLVSFAGCTS